MGDSQSRPYGFRRDCRRGLAGLGFGGHSTFLFHHRGTEGTEGFFRAGWQVVWAWRVAGSVRGIRHRGADFYPSPGPSPLKWGGERVWRDWDWAGTVHFYFTTEAQRAPRAAFRAGWRVVRAWRVAGSVGGFATEAQRVAQGAWTQPFDIDRRSPLPNRSYFGLGISCRGLATKYFKRKGYITLF